ncbi:hypothetical protein DEU56DRAFT_915918 [Suillus clintonianus]|uniref:uncharacterized protein n=1 Tax=Suillus clintonianus TaxID=1904413 RepID=UPI001B882030|nr:uncharacterized protein DEU56DRAFT_915918 [Suillus clintonianus]KAG2126798.1 hypothetical protein DEU56DRAFT_915918 [Suillus clintonianus]
MCGNFTVEGRSISLNLRIELVGDAKGSSEELAGISELNVDDNDSSARDNGAPLPLVIVHDKGEVDSMIELKERLRLAEIKCSQLEALYQKYRLRWLEENHRVKVLKGYAPYGISTCSPHQIPWSAPSPTQSEYDPEFEVQE